MGGKLKNVLFLLADERGAIFESVFSRGLNISVPGSRASGGVGVRVEEVKGEVNTGSDGL